MSVARGQFRPGIANADYGTPIEQMMRQTLVLHPGTIQEAHLIHFPEPILAPKVSLYGGCHIFLLLVRWRIRVPRTVTKSLAKSKARTRRDGKSICPKSRTGVP